MGERPFRQVAMTYLAPPWSPGGFHLAHAVRREVVVQEEPLEGRPFEGFQLLCVLLSSKGDRDQRLGLSTLKDRAAVCAGQHTGLACHGSDVLEPASVRPDAGIEDGVTNHFPLNLCKEVLDHGFLFRKPGEQFLEGFPFRCSHAGFSGEFVRVAERGLETARSGSLNSRNELFLGRRRLGELCLGLAKF